MKLGLSLKIKLEHSIMLLVKLEARGEKVVECMLGLWSDY